MKPAALTGMLVLLVAITANTQLSFLPQIGLEQSKTSVRVNELPSFSPLGSKGSLKANLRMDYRFRKGHAPYISIGTAPGAVAYTFTDASAAANNFGAAANSTQWKFEGGYQYSSKPINFKKTAKKETEKINSRHTEVKRSCGSNSSYRYNKERTETAKIAKQNNSMNLRLQPSIGVAYIPSTKENIISDGSLYQYNAGNYKIALTSGMGFELGKGKQRLFTLSVFYTKGLSNLGEQEISRVENDKISNTKLNPRTSGWGMMIGVPFSFSKTKKIASVPAKTNTMTQQKQEYKRKCGSYQGRCIRRI